MDDNKNILLADDEGKIRQVVSMYLQREGYTVEEAVDGEEALNKFNQNKRWDMIILDIMMPKMDGIRVCQEIRKTSQVPVIMLTARNDEIDRVLGLEMGADDYVGKPFSPRELVARVKAVFRRTVASDVNPSALSFPGITINLISREVKILNQEIYLTPKEFELLKILAEHPGRAFSREHLLESVWGFDYYGDIRTVDTHIKRLREKLNVKNAPSYISTIWGVGYKFEVKE